MDESQVALMAEQIDQSLQCPYLLSGRSSLDYLRTGKEMSIYMDGSLLVSIKIAPSFKKKKTYHHVSQLKKESSSPKCMSGSGHYIQRWTLHIPWSRFTKQP